MIARALGRWRSLRLRSRAGAAALVVAASAIAIVAVVQWRADPWPARAILRTPKDTWPLAFSPDGRTILTFGQGGITPWDAATGRPGATWPIEAGRAAVTGAFSPDGRTFAAAVVDGSGAVAIDWIDTATGRPRAHSALALPSVYLLAFAPDGRSLRGFLGDGPKLQEVVTWDASDGREESARTLGVSTGGGFPAISPDGRFLAVTRMGSVVVQLHDLDADRSLGALLAPSKSAPVNWGGLGFSEDGRTLAVGRQDGTIEVWDFAARKLRAKLRGHTEGYASTGLRFSPDGRTLASTGHDHGPSSAIGRIGEALMRAVGPGTREQSEVVILELATGRRLARAPTSIHPFYSPDGRTVATREPDLSVLLRDLPGRPPGDPR